MVPEDVMADGVWDHVGVGECEDALVASLVFAVAAGFGASLQALRTRPQATLARSA